jgi:HK97 family phage major capsid protein
MTTPAGIYTGSFQGYPFPPDVQAQVINLLIGGAPFAESLTRQPTVRSTLAWPTAKPTGFAWLDELAPFPVVDMADDAYVVAIAKIGGIVDVANEAVDDTSISLTAQLGQVLQDSLSRDLDLGRSTAAGRPSRSASSASPRRRRGPTCWQRSPQRAARSRTRAAPRT